MVTVAAGSGYWRDYAPSLRRIAPLLWFVIVPLSIPLAGYFPGRVAEDDRRRAGGRDAAVAVVVPEPGVHVRRPSGAACASTMRP